MSRTMLRGMLKICGWGLAAIGLVSLLLFALIVPSVSSPPALDSIAQTARSVDRSGMPEPGQFQARDGTYLAFRHYAPRAAGTDKIVVLVHGSAGSSINVHALAKAFAERGVETFAPDIRGHGKSGTRGDIRYAGQLQDDLADLVANIRQAHPATPLTLIGHSAGGGFALRMAGSSIQNLFVRTVLLAPYLGYRESTNQPNGGGWAAPDYSRIIGLAALRAMHIACCDSLPAIAFAVQPQFKQFVTSNYSYRLLQDFGPGWNFRTGLAAATRPVSIYSGADDELMQSENYQDTVGRDVNVTILKGITHMGIVGDPAAVSRIADDIAMPEVKS